MQIMKLNNNKTINSIPDKSSSKNLLHAGNFATSASLAIYKIRITNHCILLNTIFVKKLASEVIVPKLIYQQVVAR